MAEKILFDDNWLFHQGDIKYKMPIRKGPIYASAKTERMLWGPAAIRYTGGSDEYYTGNEVNTETWEQVTLPHDYIIKTVPSKEYNLALGFFKYENAWYRKKFQLGEDDKDKRILLHFEGVAVECTIYLNGCVLKRNYSGYTSFDVDISDYVNYGEIENVLAVYINAENFEGWWYEGAGIYRHVWLVKTDKVAIDTWGVYAMPKRVRDGLWHVDVETEIVNDGFEDVTVKAVTTFIDADGNPIKQSEGEVFVAKRTHAIAKYPMDIEDPILWDLDNPYLYKVHTEIFVDGNKTDESTIKTGFREFVATPNDGLYLNGKYVKIKGVCAHQDFGLTGKAVPDNVHRYKIGLIKEMGANGYRTSHYPHSEVTMDLLDEMGFIVMDETRWFDSTEYGKESLRMLMKRDRNRPSVLFWSIGNEEQHHKTEIGRRISKNLMAYARQFDTSRLILSAVDCPLLAIVYDEHDAIGINYNLHAYDEVHEKYPDKPIVASECAASGTSRSWYTDHCYEKAFLSSYDNDINKWFLGREKTWNFVMSRKWILGEYQWIAFEHRGEAAWPRLCSQSGAIDLYLQKKDAFYQNQSHWLETPMVHLLPHWNFKGLEGEEIRVCAYTNCDELELFLNGKSLGAKTIEKFRHGEWSVPFEAGELKVVAKIDGKVVCEDVQRTTKKATSLRLKLDNKDIDANGRDMAIITCYCVDEDGLEVPTAAPFVHFKSNNLGFIAATGSDITDHIPPYITDRQMRAGRITVAAQVGTEHGTFKVYAYADGLDSAVLSIEI